MKQNLVCPACWAPLRELTLDFVCTNCGRRWEVWELFPKHEPVSSKLCDEDCNHCPLIHHPNSLMLTLILNTLHEKFGDSMYKIVECNCPNLTCCYDCHIDDFVHEEGCELVARARKEA